VIIARFDGEGLSDAGPDDRVGHAVFPLAGMLDTPSAPQPRLESAAPEVPSEVPRNHERDATPLLPVQRPGLRLWIGALLIIALLVLALVVIRAARPGAPVPAAPADSVPGHLSP
jgi:hypothetical protein